MAEFVKIALEERSEKGKEAVKKLRPTGYVPAVFYGPEYKDSITAKVKVSEVAPLIRSGHWETIRILATLPDGKEEMCLMREVQKNIITKDVMHIDFIQLVKGRKVAVNVPVLLEGKEACAALKQGAVLEQTLYEIEMDVLPIEIPDSVVLNVSGLKVGDSFLVKDLSLPESAEIVIDPEEMVVSVALPQIETETEEEEEETAAGEVEVVAKGKAKEEEEE